MQTLPAVRQTLHSQIGVIVIDDKATGGRYLSTIDSQGDVVPGSQPQAIFGAITIGRAATKPAIWYTHRADGTTQKINDFEPQSAFSGMADGRGNAVAISGGEFTSRQGQYVNPVLNQPFLNQLATAGVGSQHKLAVSETLTNGERHLATTVIKRAQLTLLPPAMPACRAGMVDGHAGQICTLRQLGSGNQVGATGDLMLTIRAHFNAKDARFRVGERWHSLNAAIPLSEFRQGRAIEVFYTPQDLASYQHANRLKIANLLSADIYSASRQAQGDKFRLVMKGASGATADNILARINLLSVEDKVTGARYLTTLQGDKFQRVTSHSLAQGASWELQPNHVSPLFPLTRITKQEPASFFAAPLAAATGKGSLPLSPQGVDALIRLQPGGQQLLTAEASRSNGGSVVYRTNLIKSAHIELAAPLNPACHDATVAGVHGQVCPLRMVHAQHAFLPQNDIHAALTMPKIGNSGRWGVDGTWFSLEQRITLSQLIDGQQINLFIPVNNHSNFRKDIVSGVFRITSENNLHETAPFISVFTLKPADVSPKTFWHLHVDWNSPTVVNGRDGDTLVVNGTASRRRGTHDSTFSKSDKESRFTPRFRVLFTYNPDDNSPVDKSAILTVAGQRYSIYAGQQKEVELFDNSQGFSFEYKINSNESGGKLCGEVNFEVDGTYWEGNYYPFKQQINPGNCSSGVTAITNFSGSSVDEGQDIHVNGSFDHSANGNEHIFLKIIDDAGKVDIKNPSTVSFLNEYGSTISSTTINGEGVYHDLVVPKGAQQFSVTTPTIHVKDSYDNGHVDYYAKLASSGESHLNLSVNNIDKKPDGTNKLSFTGDDKVDEGQKISVTGIFNVAATEGQTLRIKVADGDGYLKDGELKFNNSSEKLTFSHDNKYATINIPKGATGFTITQPSLHKADSYSSTYVTYWGYIDGHDDKEASKRVDINNIDSAEKPATSVSWNGADTFYEGDVINIKGSLDAPAMSGQTISFKVYDSGGRDIEDDAKVTFNNGDTAQFVRNDDYKKVTLPKGVQSFTLEQRVSHAYKDYVNGTAKYSAYVDTGSTSSMTVNTDNVDVGIKDIPGTEVNEGDSATINVNFDRQAPAPTGKGKIYLKGLYDSATAEDLDLAHASIRFNGGSNQGVNLTKVQSLDLPQGADGMTITVPTNKDALDEGDEQFKVQVANNPDLSDSSGSMKMATVVIHNVAKPAISVTWSGADTFYEGDVINIKGTLDAPAVSGQTISFKVYDSGGRDIEDDAKVTFNNGDTAQFVRNDDYKKVTLPKGVQSFTLEQRVSHAYKDYVNGTAKYSAYVDTGSTSSMTVNTDNVDVGIKDIPGTEVNEGDSATINVNFDRQAPAPTGKGKIYLKGLYDSATAEDLDLAHASIRFNGGSNQGVDLTKQQSLDLPQGADGMTITVPTNKDALDEGDEQFKVQVANNPDLSDSSGSMKMAIVVIHNVAKPVQPAISVTWSGADTFYEGDVINIKGTLDAPAVSGQTISFKVYDSGGRDIEDDAKVTFNNGDTAQFVRNDDYKKVTLPKGVQSFTLEQRVSHAYKDYVNGTAKYSAYVDTGSTSSMTVNTDNVDVGIKDIPGTEVNEGDSATINVNFDRQAPAPTGKGKIYLKGLYDSATADDLDFAHASIRFNGGSSQGVNLTKVQSLDLPQGADGMTITVPTIKDALDEGDEQFKVQVANNPDLSDSSGSMKTATVVIHNVDKPVQPATAVTWSGADTFYEEDVINIQGTLDAPTLSNQTISFKVEDADSRDIEGDAKVTFDNGNTAQFVTNAGYTKVTLPAGVRSFMLKQQVSHKYNDYNDGTAKYSVYVDTGSASSMTVNTKNVDVGIKDIPGTEVQEGDNATINVNFDRQAPAPTGKGKIYLQGLYDSATADDLDFAHASIQFSNGGNQGVNLTKVQSLDLPQGADGMTITVPTNKDTLDEGDEQFKVQVANNPDLSDSSGSMKVATVTIKNNSLPDDTLRIISIDGADTYAGGTAYFTAHFNRAITSDDLSARFYVKAMMSKGDATFADRNGDIELIEGDMDAIITDAFYNQWSKAFGLKLSNESDIKQIGFYVYLAPYLDHLSHAAGQVKLSVKDDANRIVEGYANIASVAVNPSAEISIDPIKQSVDAKFDPSSEDATLEYDIVMKLSNIFNTRATTGDVVKHYLLARAGSVAKVSLMVDGQTGMSPDGHASCLFAIDGRTEHVAVPAYLSYPINSAGNEVKIPQVCNAKPLDMDFALVSGPHDGWRNTQFDEDQGTYTYKLRTKLGFVMSDPGSEMTAESKAPWYGRANGKGNIRAQLTLPSL